MKKSSMAAGQDWSGKSPPCSTKSSRGTGMAASTPVLTVLAALVALCVGIAAADTASDIQPIRDPSLLWGTYRPQLYFGIRAALPDSFLSGLVWFSPHRLENFVKARHDANEDDKIDGYGYTYHDGRSFAIQEIRDTENNYLLETTWIKTASSCDSNSKAGSWAARIKGTVLDESRPAVLSAVYYAAQESANGVFQATFDPEKYIDGLPSRDGGSRGDDNVAEGRFFSGNAPSKHLADFNMRFKDSPGAPNRPVVSSLARHSAHEEEFAHGRTHWHYFGARIPRDVLWRGKDVISSDIASSVQKAFSAYGQESLPQPADLLTLPDAVHGTSNFVALQRTFSGNFSIDVFYDSQDTPKGSLLDGDSFNLAIEASKRSYNHRLKEVLPINNQKDHGFVRDLTSQIIGSVGYYYGKSIVDRSFKLDHDDLAGTSAPSDPQETEPHQLLTATPSRSKFPRGFYWDEGFHLSHIGAWDMNLAMEILQGWFKLIDEDGWVEREQILGEEARSRVPPEFQAQNPSHANPPTLTALFLNDYLTRLEKQNVGRWPLDTSDIEDSCGESVGGSECLTSSIDNPVLARKMLTELYPNLRRHYLWFRNTQRGQTKEWGRKCRAPREAFRWRGRTKDHVLTSGLDDYPRAPEPHPGELHVDLLSWMGSFAEAMMRIARAIDEEDDAEEYERSYNGIVANLDDLHWDKKQQMYCDASVDQSDESFHVCHRGYISLFPLFTMLIKPDNPHLGKVLDLLRDPKHLWTKAGLLSLSKQEAMFGQGENYWRGPIWIPINYYVLRALKLKYAAQPGPFQVKAAEIYKELRDNVVANVQKEYERTNFTWEQFNARDGHGQRSHPFTGWTSMAALILAEAY